MKVHASLKNLRIAPRKVRLVAHTIVGLSVSAAVVEIGKQVKRASDPLHCLLQSAIANAKNNFGLDEANLYVAHVRVGDGLRLKRFEPRAFGRAMPIIKRSSNIQIVLEERVEGHNRTVVSQKSEVVTVASETATKDTVAKEGIKKGGFSGEQKKEVKPKTVRAARKVFQRKAS